ncbi:MAG: hypothetical protein F6J93_19755 [Oscillatoria sp. SIO1A7]|nr:hypothetical protein [Oscillatoria sp. SIO1A7]
MPICNLKALRLASVLVRFSVGSGQRGLNASLLEGLLVSIDRAILDSDYGFAVRGEEALERVYPAEDDGSGLRTKPEAIEHFVVRLETIVNH